MKAFPAILELGTDFYDIVKPASFPEAKLRYWNQEWVQKIITSQYEKHSTSSGPEQTHIDKLYPEYFLKKHFWNFEAMADNLPQPLALRYHGHQFRHYNHELGDGRGFLAAQFLDKNKLYDLGTKGSGTTPYSRRGDGRLTLKGAVREALATELLESLGVNTSKTFCFFETGENLERNDEPSPTRAAVLTRFSHGHIRFGTFQRLAFLHQVPNLEKLTKYCLKYYYDLDMQKTPIENPGTELLKFVRKRTADLAAQVMMSGFVHGVLNTDNMNISGELFDYGPYRFLPSYDIHFTATYFDQQGLYCYGRQPESFLWGLHQLGISLQRMQPNLDVDEVLSGFSDEFNQSVQKIFFQRLNIQSLDDSTNEQLLRQFFQFLEFNSRRNLIHFEQTFFDLYGGLQNQRLTNSPQHEVYQGESFQNLRAILQKYSPKNRERLQHPYWQKTRPETLLIDEIESIWKPIAENDNWASFEEKIQKLRLFRGLYNE